MNREVVALDKETKIEGNKCNSKLIVKAYNKNGKITYYDQDDCQDGFLILLRQLEEKKHAQLYISLDKLIPVLELINELNYSIKNAQLDLIYKNDKHWQISNFYF